MNAPSRFAARLAAFVERWYAVPLDRARDGESAAEIAATEHARGKMPGVLRDWYALVGRRVRSVQDQPLSLAHARARTSSAALDVYVESQGNWIVAAPLDVRGNDPRVVFTPSASSVKSGWTDLVAWSPPTLGAFLLAAVTRETLVAAAGGEPGPLGALRDGVVGSYAWAYRGEPPLPPSKLPSLPAMGTWWATRDAVAEEVNASDARHTLRSRDLVWMATSEAVARRRGMPPLRPASPRLYRG